MVRNAPYGYCRNCRLWLGEATICPVCDSPAAIVKEINRLHDKAQESGHQSYTYSNLLGEQLDQARKAGAEVERLKTEVAELKSELAANASVLARQCDLAREAENNAAFWKGEVERLSKEKKTDW